MKYLLPLFFLSLFAVQSQASCVSEVKKTVSAQTQRAKQLHRNTAVFRNCLLWVTDRSQYLSQKAKAGKEPCPSESTEWQALLPFLKKNVIGALKKTCSSNACKNGCGSDWTLGTELKNNGIEGVYSIIDELNPAGRAGLANDTNIIPASGQQWHTPAESLTSI